MKGIILTLLATVAVLAFSGAAIGAGEGSRPCLVGTGTDIGFGTTSSWNGIGIDMGKLHEVAMNSGITLESGRTGISTGLAKSSAGIGGTGTLMGIGTNSTRDGIGIDTGKPHEDAIDSGTTLTSGRTGIGTGIRTRC